MLVLSRQRGETIMIGDDVEVTIIDIRGDKVRLGIRARRSRSVHRKEVYDLIHAENQSASRLNPDVIDGLPKRVDGAPALRIVPPEPDGNSHPRGAAEGGRVGH